MSVSLKYQASKSSSNIGFMCSESLVGEVNGDYLGKNVCHFKQRFKNMLWIRCLACNANLAKCYGNSKIGHGRWNWIDNLVKLFVFQFLGATNFQTSDFHIVNYPTKNPSL